MAIFNATDLQAFLGKTVRFDQVFQGKQSEHQGQVIAVISVIPGSAMEPALMVDEGNGRREYFHLGDITIRHVQP